MNFMIFSNMKITEEVIINIETINEIIRRKLKILDDSKKYGLPNIIFWNLQSTDIFPSLSSNSKITMISGHNPKLLNLFCDKKNQSCSYNIITPWNKLKEILNNKRYKILEDKITLTIN